MPHFIEGSEIGKLLSRIVNTTINQIPPQAKFSDSDISVIMKYRPLLESMTEDIVKGFYDTLFSHSPPTATVFQPGERPLREKTLRDWWIRTLSGPFNEDYWLWQAYVASFIIEGMLRRPCSWACGPG
ncbi:protoglobin domain-containing protein [Vulcanisaeta distributa]|uniref:protoglobin domain-containing protein n=1 Tax=Vulcanisaeta distributa TaxID=164451 RepID=UPI0006D14ECD|nr:protoglobin domain-containing protein [Vulcanisaeta distributa]